MKATPEQQAWLREFYRMYSRYHIGKKLGIDQKTLTVWMKELGLKKKQDARRGMLDDEGKKFIRENYHRMTHKAISEKLSVTMSVVQMFCFHNKLTKKGPNKVQHVTKEIIPYKQPEPVKYERPPARYDNENAIDKYLKMDL
jgi:hypothetical protein